MEDGRSSVLGVDEKEAEEEEEEVEAGKWVLCVSSYVLLLIRFVANKLKVEIVGVN